MQGKSVKELRALARKKGIKGYSRMRKDELMLVLKKAQTRTQNSSQSTLKPGKKASTSTLKSAATTPPSSDDEQRIEDAKFMLDPQAQTVQEFADDLGEDIDTLPDLRKARISLLPQKPGILHAFWSVAPEQLARQPELCLRLSFLQQQTIVVLQEAPLSHAQGHWYFHVDPNLMASEVYLQLGHYSADGEFHTDIERGIVRLPRLSASSAIDARWWLSESDFRRMYLRSGGRLLPGGKLAWSGGAGSSGSTDITSSR